nr:ATP-binding protein [Modestobacter roseus]
MSTRRCAGRPGLERAAGAATARRQRVEEVVPAAARTILSLRDIGYELPQAVADLVDNSVSHGASRVSIDLHFDGTDSWIRIADNGRGMDTATLTESLRYGSMRDYDSDDLGKFGFGLKTASTSQCRRVVVASRRALSRARIEVRALDLAQIERTNRWEILIVGPAERPGHLVEPLKETTGTVVLWEDLDRILDYKDPWGGWARRKLLDRAEAIAEHLGMVFHRFLAGEVSGHKVEIHVNGAAVDPWDPFCRNESGTTALPEHDFRVASDEGMGIVHVRPFVLPDKGEFSDASAWQRASGPLKWNRQQGLYIYRANRLIQWGGWSRIRTIDEHSKLARVALDFSPNLDSAFGINISKAIVKLPTDFRDDIEPVVNQVARIASQRYRKGNETRPTGRTGASPMTPRPAFPAHPAPAASGLTPPATATTTRYTDHVLSAPTPAGSTGSSIEPPIRRAIEAAAQAAGEQEALQRIVDSLRRTAPEVASDLGW